MANNYIHLFSSLLLALRPVVLVVAKKKKWCKGPNLKN